jgi:TolB-like protein
MAQDRLVNSQRAGLSRRFASAARPMSSRAAPRCWADPAAPSIAVLAFADMSPGKDQEYFADGLSEELLNLLAKVPGLRVAARTSSFAFKGKNEDVAQIGQKLHVAHILEGSVRKAGDQIRITTQLINVSDGFHVWSETYDRRITDVFAVQDEIAKAVVYAREGKRAEALAELQKISRLSEDRYAYPIVHALTGQRPEAEREALELEALSKKEYVPATIMASVWAALGNKDKTFTALRRVCQERDGAWGASVKVDPLYDGLRSDPRYGEILDCLNLR